MKYEKIQELYEKFLKIETYGHIIDFPDNYTTNQVERAKYKLWKEFDSIKEELLNSMQETWESELIPKERTCIVCDKKFTESIGSSNDICDDCLKKTFSDATN